MALQNGAARKLTAREACLESWAEMQGLQQGVAQRKQPIISRAGSKCRHACRRYSMLSLSKEDRDGAHMAGAPCMAFCKSLLARFLIPATSRFSI